MPEFVGLGLAAGWASGAAMALWADCEGPLATRLIGTASPNGVGSAGESQTMKKNTTT